MKKIFLSILAAVAALTATAQNMNVKAIVVYKTDGTRDTTILAKRTAVVNSRFYGKENPVDDDYIRLNFSISSDYYITCNCSLTAVGRDAPYSSYGIMLSSERIDTVPKYKRYNDGGGIYFVDDNTWYYPDQMDKWTFPYEGKLQYYPGTISLVPDQHYYARAYYVLDNNMYFSSEVEFRAPKTLSAVHDYYYAGYDWVNIDYIVNIDAETILSNHAELFGDITDYNKALLKQYIVQVLSGKDAEVLHSMASKTETCDDGTLYILDEVPADILAEVLQNINDELAKTYYLKAEPDVVYTGNTNTSYFGTASCDPQIITADEKWGIRDNQYLSTPLSSNSGIASKPRIAFELSHLVQQGKTYDVTLTMAPNTQDEADTLITCFNVYIANVAKDGSVPMIADAQTFGNDSTIGGKQRYVAKPQEMKVVTMQYTATNFADRLYMQLEHGVSFVTPTNRKKYGRDFRIVGIEVKPHEE